MELVAELVNNQFALCIPVALVLIGAVLVFVFGFKSAEQPPFDKLSFNSNDERKPAGKRRKIKEKKPTVNGNVLNVVDNKSDKSPSKRSTKDQDVSTTVNPPEKKKSETPKTKKPEKADEAKVKKNVKVNKSGGEKPVDFDDGNWETVPTKGDKKKKQESPVKKDKKPKKTDNSVEIEKLAKEIVSQEFPEADNVKESAPVQAEVVEQEEETPVAVEIVAVEVKKEKSEKKIKKDVVEKVEPVSAQIADTVDEPIVEQPLIIKHDKPSEGGVAFDELGDVWTEAKVAKKSKKKSRRDN